VVAVTLLGLVLATGLELLAVGLRSVKAAGDYTEATLLAKRTLTEISQGTLAPGTTDGASGVYRWTANVTPEDAEEAGTLPVRLYTLRVTVAWPAKRGEKGVELVTLHAAARSEVRGWAGPTPPDAAPLSAADAQPGETP
jgi:hypothetical protein